MDGISADEVTEILQSGDGSLTRFVFRNDGQEFFFEMKTSNLLALMPTLSTVSTRAHSEGERTALGVSQVRADLDEAGEFLLTLVNSVGTEMTFQLALPQVTELSAFCDEALHMRSGSKASH